MFNGNYGVINFFFSILGIDTINWLYSLEHSLTVLIIYGVWSLIPFTTIVLLSSMQSINQKYYIIAKIDHASGWQMFRRISLPMMFPTILIVIILNMISSVKVFDELFPLFGGMPGAYYNLHTVVYYIYYQIQGTNRYGVGLAAAASIILLVVTFFFSLIVFTLRKVWGRRNG
jgi:multiple sugar transport system permease protein